MSDLSLAQLQENKLTRLEKNDQTICAIRMGKEIFAVADTCTHAEASLTEGYVIDFTIQCWQHGAEFDLRSGEVLTLPATEALQTYTVQIDGDSVTIEA